MTQAILNYIKTNVLNFGKHYGSEIQGHLLEGIGLAVENSQIKSHQISKQEILAIFDAIHPAERANMKFLTRKRSVSILSTPDQRHHLSKEGLCELFEWVEKNKTEYGPRIEIISHFNDVKHFKSIAEMRRQYDCETNEDLAEYLENELKNKRNLHETLRYIPIFDSLDPFIDKKTVKPEELELLDDDLDFSNYPVNNDVEQKFEELLATINKKPQLSIEEIAQFVKDMMLLHPFPDGNTRTFTLAVLNQLLLKNNYGVCLNIGERVPFLTVASIANNIRKNLVPQSVLNVKKVPYSSAVKKEDCIRVDDCIKVTEVNPPESIMKSFLKKGRGLFALKPKHETNKLSGMLRFW